MLFCFISLTLESNEKKRNCCMTNWKQRYKVYFMLFQADLALSYHSVTSIKLLDIKMTLKIATRPKPPNRSIWIFTDWYRLFFWAYLYPLLKRLLVKCLTNFIQVKQKVQSGNYGPLVIILSVIHYVCCERQEPFYRLLESVVSKRFRYVMEQIDTKWATVLCVLGKHKTLVDSLVK